METRKAKLIDIKNKITEEKKALEIKTKELEVALSEEQRIVNN